MEEPAEDMVMRRNGFSKPHHPLQLVSWALLPFFVLSYSVTVAPLLGQVWGVACTVIHCLSVLIVVPTAYYCTKVNPCDPAVESAYFLRERIQAVSFDKENDSDSNSVKHYCTVCDVNINAQSKHCRLCNKCVDVFDHHCKWLNNCVGAKSYKTFVVMLAAVFCMSVIEFSLLLYVLVNYVADDDELKDRCKQNSRKEYTDDR